PFLFRLLRRRRFGWLAYMAAVYVVGFEFWLYQLNTGSAIGIGVTSTAATADVAAAVAHGMNFPAQVDQFTTIMHWSVLATWETPVAVLCVVAAMIAWRSQDA